MNVLRVQELPIHKAPVLLQTENHLLYRQPLFASHQGGVKRHKATLQAQHQVAIVRIFTVHLTGTYRQQVFQGPKECSIELRRFHGRMSRGALMTVSRHISTYRQELDSQLALGSAFMATGGRVPPPRCSPRIPERSNSVRRWGRPHSAPRRQATSWRCI
jgi:hypothetical protein